MISNELCDELCQLMTNVKIKVVECFDTSAIDGVFKDSFATDADISPDDIKTMAETWVTVEHMVFAPDRTYFIILLVDGIANFY